MSKTDQIQRWLQEKVPGNLNEIYRFILSSVIPKEDYAQSFFLFQFICVAFGSLGLEDIQYALAMPDPTTPYLDHGVRDILFDQKRMELRIKALSGGLLEVAKTSIVPSASTSSVDLLIDRIPRVQVIHQTVTDFLLLEGLALLSRLENNPKNFFHYHGPLDGPGDIRRRCHTTVYRHCLFCLSCYYNEDDLVYAHRYIFDHRKRACSRLFHEFKDEVSLLNQIPQEFFTWLRMR